MTYGRHAITPMAHAGMCHNVVRPGHPERVKHVESAGKVCVVTAIRGLLVYEVEAMSTGL